MTVTREQILDIVKEHLMDNLEDLEDVEFDSSKSMKDLGANSLDIVEVVSCTMRDLKVKVPRSELSTLTNVDGLVDLLVKVVAEKEAAAS
jgi:acyl carrier protein